jgi:HSP20 family protein
MTTTELSVARLGPISLWGDFDGFFGPFERHFSELAGFPRMAALAGRNGPGFRAARTDVIDTGAAYRITAEVPGIAKENLDLRLHGQLLELRAEQSRTQEKKDGAVVHQERAYAGFYRAVELPEPIKASDAKATLANGVLVVELPKETPAPSPADVQIKVE